MSDLFFDLFLTNLFKRTYLNKTDISLNKEKINQFLINLTKINNYKKIRDTTFKFRILYFFKKNKNIFKNYRKNNKDFCDCLLQYIKPNKNNDDNDNLFLMNLKNNTFKARVHIILLKQFSDGIKLIPNYNISFRILECNIENIKNIHRIKLKSYNYNNKYIKKQIKTFKPCISLI